MDITNKRTIIIALVAVLVVIAVAFVVMQRGSQEAGGDAEQREATGDRGTDDALASITEQFSQGPEKPRRAELTQAERDENEAEYRRMRETIPGNLFIPGDLTPEEQKERRALLRDMIVLGNRVRKGTATTEEKKRYYELKKKEASDKVEFMEYIIKRVGERRAETGKQYLDDKTIEESAEIINTFKKEAQKFDEELKKL